MCYVLSQLLGELLANTATTCCNYCLPGVSAQAWSDLVCPACSELQLRSRRRYGWAEDMMTGLLLSHHLIQQTHIVHLLLLMPL
jgi:hypothetical protein